MRPELTAGGFNQPGPPHSGRSPSPPSWHWATHKPGRNTKTKYQIVTKAVTSQICIVTFGANGLQLLKTAALFCDYKSERKTATHNPLSRWIRPTMPGAF